MAGHWVKLLQNLIRHTEATRNRFPVLGSFTPRTVETVASDCLRLPVDICGFCQDMKWEEDHLISVTPSECAGCTLDTTWTFQLRRGTFQQCQQELRTSSLRSGGKAIQPQRIQRCSQCRAVSYCDHTCQKARPCPAGSHGNWSGVIHILNIFE